MLATGFSPWDKVMCDNQSREGRHNCAAPLGLILLLSYFPRAEARG